MRVPALLCLTLLLSGLLTPLEAAARGSDAAAVTVQKLLEKGYQHLRNAQRAHFSENKALAAREGQQAERYFRDVLAQDPRNVSAALFGGQSATLAGDLRGASGWVERYRRLSPAGEGDPDFHFLSAFVHLLGAERPDRALRSLMRMYSLNPRVRTLERDNLWYLALNEHGRNLLEAGKEDDAIEQFKAAMRIARRLGSRKKELLMLGNVGIALQRGLRYLEANDIFQSLIQADRNNPVWHWQLGLNFAAQSKFAEAVPIYREVMRLRATGFDVPEMEHELGQVRLRLGNCLRHLAERQRDPKKRALLFERARVDIRSYMTDRPKDARGHKWLAMLLFENLERPYEALPHFVRAFELDSLCADSLKYMIRIHEHYPPPPDQSPADDPAAAAAQLKAWRAPIEAWKKDIEEGAERRKEALKARTKKLGDNGCV